MEEAFSLKFNIERRGQGMEGACIEPWSRGAIKVGILGVP